MLILCISMVMNGHRMYKITLKRYYIMSKSRYAVGYTHQTPRYQVRWQQSFKMIKQCQHKLFVNKKCSTVLSHFQTVDPLAIRNEISKYTPKYYLLYTDFTTCSMRWTSLHIDFKTCCMKCTSHGCRKRRNITRNS